MILIELDVVAVELVVTEVVGMLLVVVVLGAVLVVVW